jgi:hypothetical protein
MQRKKVAVETACGHGTDSYARRLFLWMLGMSMVNRSSSVNSAVSPEDLHKLFEQALNSAILMRLLPCTHSTDS